MKQVRIAEWKARLSEYLRAVWILCHHRTGWARDLTIRDAQVPDEPFGWHDARPNVQSLDRSLKLAERISSGAGKSGRVSRVTLHRANATEHFRFRDHDNDAVGFQTASLPQAGLLRPLRRVAVVREAITWLNLLPVFPETTRVGPSQDPRAALLIGRR